MANPQFAAGRNLLVCRNGEVDRLPSGVRSSAGAGAVEFGPVLTVGAPLEDPRMTSVLSTVAAAAVGVAQVARKLLLHRNLELQGIARLPRPDDHATLEVPVRRGVGVGLGAELQIHGRTRPAQDHAVVEVAGRSFYKGIVQREAGVDAEPLGDREIIPVAAADRAGSLREQDRSRRGLRIGGHVHISRTAAGRAVAGHGELHRSITHAGALVGKHPANRFARGGIDEFEMLGTLRVSTSPSPDAVWLCC